MIILRGTFKELLDIIILVLTPKISIGVSNGYEITSNAHGCNFMEHFTILYLTLQAPNIIITCFECCSGKTVYSGWLLWNNAEPLL